MTESPDGGALDGNALDGNALAGPLAAVYAFDVTRALARCAHCGDVSVVACAVVFVTAMGTVARCRECGEVLLVVVGTPTGTSVAARGVAWVRA
ncbi:hypothetical protein CLV28_2100 [Sediminihabitans luteus]|uniref:Uncharacterized protein n=1 Tax=Sediminihabitans luteus TaxID=1138585 RepID=A0A2M9CEF6_9CELL|nr:DUF6510 family protein [Sediminihabitans luteus]PJJ70269.1 hypothetical protein CLV28_2100 [Sediminihabitans luteus]GII97740.1 hypothetical protein Slu03_01180 [Sediminihabitans luteus]